ncbi:MAG: hypothetical protein AB1439_04485 [candidate division FCPU426 bacterium]
MQILLISDLRGELERLALLLARRGRFAWDAVCFCGNIVAGTARAGEWEAAARENRPPNRNSREIIEEAYQDLRTYKQFCNALNQLELPVLLVPGEYDAPEERYFLFLQQAAFGSDTLIVVQENIVKVGPYLFSGFGGRLTEAQHEDYFLLRYDRRETVFGLRRFHYLNPPRILLFHTPPALPDDEPDQARLASPLLTDLINQAAPSLLFCSSPTRRPKATAFGGTVVVQPGSLAEGHFAVVQTKTREASFHTL